jgi:hypothetical protein
MIIIKTGDGFLFRYSVKVETEYNGIGGEMRFNLCENDSGLGYSYATPSGSYVVYGYDFYKHANPSGSEDSTLSWKVIPHRALPVLSGNN